MRTFGYFLLLCGLGLVGFGVFLNYASMGTVRKTEEELAEVRRGFEEARGTPGEAEAKGKMEELHLRILEEHPVAGEARAVSTWWMAGGGVVVVIGLVGVLAGAPRRRKTKGRYWA